MFEKKHTQEEHTILGRWGGGPTWPKLKRSTPGTRFRSRHPLGPHVFKIGRQWSERMPGPASLRRHVRMSITFAHRYPCALRFDLYLIKESEYISLAHPQCSIFLLRYRQKAHVFEPHRLASKVPPTCLDLFLRHMHPSLVSLIEKHIMLPPNLYIVFLLIYLSLALSCTGAGSTRSTHSRPRPLAAQRYTEYRTRRSSDP